MSTDYDAPIDYDLHIDYDGHRLGVAKRRIQVIKRKPKKVIIEDAQILDFPTPEPSPVVEEVKVKTNRAMLLFLAVD